MWITESEYRYYLPENLFVSNKWAMFDLDETLITTRNGLFPEQLGRILKSPDNWLFLGFSIPDILLEYQTRGYTIIIITNQENINNIRFDRIEQIRLKLLKYGINVIILIATSEKYKKPNIKLATKLMKLCKIEELHSKSFMVGDAAKSSTSNNYLAYNWSADDKNFAKNLGVKFKIPSDIFYSNYNYLLGNNHEDNNIFNHDIESKNFRELKENVIVMMGAVGTGKSTFSEKFVELHPKYIRLESDKFSNQSVMFNKFKKLNKEGNKFFIIEAMNRNKELRKKYVTYAEQNNLSTIVVWSITNGSIWDLNREKSKKMGNYLYFKEFQGPDENPRENYVKLYRNT